MKPRMINHGLQTTDYTDADKKRPTRIFIFCHCEELATWQSRFGQDAQDN